MYDWPWLDIESVHQRTICQSSLFLLPGDKVYSNVMLGTPSESAGCHHKMTSELVTEWRVNEYFIHRVEAVDAMKPKLILMIDDMEYSTTTAVCSVEFTLWSAWRVRMREQWSTSMDLGRSRRSFVLYYCRGLACCHRAFHAQFITPCMHTNRRTNKEWGKTVEVGGDVSVRLSISYCKIQLN